MQKRYWLYLCSYVPALGPVYPGDFSVVGVHGVPLAVSVGLFDVVEGNNSIIPELE